ncbi:PilZ domain-containing protein [Paludibacterium paludis]|uniref:Cyclic di-GMP receptor atypical PilZ domain-containing protein n=1 Tax=Paludibacterium paludis TaxID=1225769 RepID=A0A918P536_9NEIS|nr:PilZ domain-containing protein [Paludibacterium paludis]GGY21646.1 hypothetical protein GCM10011289_26620 [Paludibacterium paludis]
MNRLDTLAALDTASFSALLPFACAQRESADELDDMLRETRLAMKVLAAPSDAQEDPAPILLRLEAKLDLALEVSLRNRHTERPPLTPCRVGLEALSWSQAAPLKAGDAVLLTLYPNPDSALRLALPGVVTRCARAADGHYNLVADIREGLGEITRPMWEKWVFRRHRRAIVDR